MPRCSPRIAVLLAVGIVARVQAEPPKKAPPSVTKIVDKAVSAVRNNRKPYDEANKKVLTEGEKALNEELDRLTKAGRLDEAIATREVIKSFKETVMKQADAPMAVEEKPMTAKPQQSPKPLLERMVGKWTHPDSAQINEVTNDGAWIERKKTGEPWADGKIRLVSDDEAEVLLTNGAVNWRHRLWMIDSDTIAIRTFRPEGREHGDGGFLFRSR